MLKDEIDKKKIQLKTQIKTNYKTQFPINLILNDEIKKKIN
jgi:hypothetical protein